MYADNFSNRNLQGGYKNNINAKNVMSPLKATDRLAELQYKWT